MCRGETWKNMHRQTEKGQTETWTVKAEERERETEKQYTSTAREKTAKRMKTGRK